MHDNAGAEQTDKDLTTLHSYSEHPELVEGLNERIWNITDLGAIFELFAEGFMFRGSSALALLRTDSRHGIPSSFHGILSTVLATDLEVRHKNRRRNPGYDDAADRPQY